VNVPELLEVVSVTMRPRAETGVPTPPNIECYTALEPSARIDAARVAAGARFKFLMATAEAGGYVLRAQSRV